MGNNNSNNEQKLSIQNDLVLEEKHTSLNYGEISIMRHKKQNIPYAVKTLKTNSEMEFKALLGKIDLRMQLKDPPTIVHIIEKEY